MSLPNSYKTHILWIQFWFSQNGSKWIFFWGGGNVSSVSLSRSITQTLLCSFHLSHKLNNNTFFFLPCFAIAERPHHASLSIFIATIRSICFVLFPSIHTIKKKRLCNMSCCCSCYTRRTCTLAKTYLIIITVGKDIFSVAELQKKRRINSLSSTF